jgi:hypothetical protein
MGNTASVTPRFKVRVLRSKDVPLSRYPGLQAEQRTVLCVWHKVPVAGVPCGHVQLFAAQELAPGRLCLPAAHALHAGSALVTPPVMLHASTNAPEPLLYGLISKYTG